MGRGKSQRSLELIDAARDILEEIQPASVRAVCYRLFTLGILASMSKNETNRVSRLLTDAREVGSIPWEWIVDETREAERTAGWENPAAFVESVKRAYRRDHWALQPLRVEVWSVKGTVRGMLAPVLHEYGVTFRVMHGYASATTVREVMMENVQARKPFKVLYCGDWDPSGLHMSEEDLPNRLHAYWADYWTRKGVAWWKADHAAKSVDLSRIALNADDVLHGDLPSFPAESKRGDARWGWYMNQYGHCEGQCWELDALNPNILRDRVEQAIRAEIEWAVWDRCTTAEGAKRASLQTVLDGWHGI